MAGSLRSDQSDTAARSARDPGVTLAPSCDGPRSVAAQGNAGIEATLCRRNLPGQDLDYASAALALVVEPGGAVALAAAPADGPVDLPAPTGGIDLGSGNVNAILCRRVLK